MIAFDWRRILFTLVCSCCFRRGRWTAAVQLSQSSIDDPSSLFSVARAIQASHGTFGAARRPRGRPVFELPEAGVVISRNLQDRSIAGNLKRELWGIRLDCRGGLIRNPSKQSGPAIYSTIIYNFNITYNGACCTSVAAREHY